MATPSHLPLIIGLYSPYPRMGKSTIAKRLAEEFGYLALKFSTPVKEPLYELGLNVDEIEGPLKDQPCARLEGRTPRDEMGRIARDLFSQHGDDYLSRHLSGQIATALSSNQRVVIDDVRYPANVSLIRQYPRTQIWRLFSTQPHAGNSHDTGRLEDVAFDLKLTHTGNPNDMIPAIKAHLQRPMA